MLYHIYLKCMTQVAIIVEQIQGATLYCTQLRSLAKSSIARSIADTVTVRQDASSLASKHLYYKAVYYIGVCELFTCSCSETLA